MLSLVAPEFESRAAARLTGFAGFLHANGYAVGGADAVPVLDVAARVGVLDAPTLRWSLRALLCGRADEWQRFDELFDAWDRGAQILQLQNLFTGEGGVIGLAAKYAGWAIDYKRINKLAASVLHEGNGPKSE